MFKELGLLSNDPQQAALDLCESFDAMGLKTQSQSTPQDREAAPAQEMTIDMADFGISFEDQLDAVFAQIQTQLQMNNATAPGFSLLDESAILQLKHGLLIYIGLFISKKKTESQPNYQQLSVEQVDWLAPLIADTLLSNE